MKATSCKCCLCGNQAAVFWPVFNPDTFTPKPYCRKCADKTKSIFILKVFRSTIYELKNLVKTWNQEM